MSLLLLINDAFILPLLNLDTELLKLISTLLLQVFIGLEICYLAFSQSWTGRLCWALC